MKALQEFQVAAREGGFVEVQGDELEAETVLWFRKATEDAHSKTHQRLCIDSLLKSATVYWVNVVGTLDSQTFRTTSGMQQWFALHPAT